MSREERLKEVKAALTAALGLKIDVYEAHPFQTCDYGVNFSVGLKVFPSKSDNFTNGALYVIMVGNLKFKSFIHYSHFGTMDHYGYTYVSFMEINECKNGLVECAVYVYGRRFTGYIDVPV